MKLEEGEIMAYSQLKVNKDGKLFYEIFVSRGRNQPKLTQRWYVPEGWSKKSIERELAKVTAEFERQCREGEIISRAEKRELEALKEAEAAKILTVKQYGEKVFMPDLCVRCSENTRSNYQGNLDYWIYPRLGARKMPEVTAADINALLLSIQAQGKSQSTCLKVYTILQGLFKSAYMQDMIEKNPMDKVKRPKARKDEIKSSEADSYTADELRHILSCLEKEPLKWQAFVRLISDTGMRRGECCGLEWKNVDFQNNVVTISKNICYTVDKGVYVDTPKNGKIRTVDVDPAIMKLLRQLRNEQAEHHLSPYVFNQDDSADVMHPQSPTHFFRSFGERYGIDHFHPHKLRHTFASVAITYGADIASVSEKLGHSDKAVTLRMYTHADAESMKRASNIFRAAINGDNPY